MREFSSHPVSNCDDLSFCVTIDRTNDTSQSSALSAGAESDRTNPILSDVQNLNNDNSLSLWRRGLGVIKGGWKLIRYLMKPSERFTPYLDVENSLKGLIIWTRTELFWSMGLFVFTGWFLFFVLGHLTESTGGLLREKVSGWLIFMAIILTCRTVSLSVVVEEFKWHKTLIRTHDVRPSLITLLQSNRMAATRFFHIIYILWWYFVPINVVKSVLDEAAIYATKPTTTPDIIKQPGSSNVPFNPTPEYYFALRTLIMTINISRYLWAIEWIPVLFTILYHLFKYRLTYADQLLVFKPPPPNQNLLILSFGNGEGPNTGRQPPPVPVPKRILKSFPLIIWPHSIDKNEPIDHTINNQFNKAKSIEQSNTNTTSISTIPIPDDNDHVAFRMCTICLSHFTGGDLLRLLPCSHLFHKDCIDTWLSERANCPFRCEVDLTQPFNGCLSPTTNKLPDSILRQLPQK